MSKFSKSALIFGICLAMVGLAVAGLLSFKTFALTPVQQDVALNFTVTPEWQEIVPEIPLTVNRDRQTVYLVIDGFNREIGDPEWNIKLPDGAIAKPEVQVVDDAGNIYELTGRSWAGSSAGFSIGKPMGIVSDLPLFRTYPKIRIRSNVGFTCSKIIWDNKNHP